MKWDLFIADVMARIVGVIGMVAAMPWVVYCFTQVKFSGLQISFEMAVGTSAFLVIIALLFLLPNVHDRFMRISRPGIFRFLFVLVALFWTIGAVFGLRDQYLLSRFYGAPDTTTWVIIAMAATLCFGYLLLIAPLGLAWREPRREHALKQIALREVEIQRASRAQGFQTSPTAQSAPVTFRHTDVYDILASTPIMMASIACLYGMKFSTTARTAEWASVSSDGWIIGSALAFVVFLCPILLAGIFRAPLVSAMRSKKKPPSVALRVVLAIPMAVALNFGMSWYGIPSVSNFFLQPSVETITYDVVRVSTGRRTSGCTTLRSQDVPDHTVSVCGVSGEMVVPLRSGDTIEATGPLGFFSHTFERVRIVR